MLITPTQSCKGSIYSYKTIKEPADSYIKGIALVAILLPGASSNALHSSRAGAA